MTTNRRGRRRLTTEIRWDPNKVYRAREPLPNELPIDVWPSSLYLVNKTDNVLVQFKVDESGLWMQPGQPWDPPTDIGNTCSLSDAIDCINGLQFKYLTDVGADQPHTIWLALQRPDGTFVTKIVTDVAVDAETDDTFIVVE